MRASRTGIRTRHICCFAANERRDAVNAQDLQFIVGDDLSELVAANASSPVVSIERVSSLGSASWPRAAYRFLAADGSSLKGCRLESSRAAQRAVERCRHLPDGSFPPVLAHYNAAILFPWIEGTVLSLPVAPAYLGEIGGIQRSVHAVDVPADWPESAGMYPGLNSRDEFRSKVAWLTSTGELDADEGQRVVHIAEAHIPLARPVRLVHGDICPENVVLDRHGRPHVVDNDGVDFHAPEFDLARTWYRWPMTREERTVFEDGYGDAAVIASYREHFMHWALVVLVGVIEFRARFQLGGASTAARRLRELLR